LTATRGRLPGAEGLHGDFLRPSVFRGGLLFHSVGSGRAGAATTSTSGGLRLKRPGHWVKRTRKTKGKRKVGRAQPCGPLALQGPWGRFFLADSGGKKLEGKFGGGGGGGGGDGCDLFRTRQPGPRGARGGCFPISAKQLSASSARVLLVTFSPRMSRFLGTTFSFRPAQRGIRVRQRGGDLTLSGGRACTWRGQGRGPPRPGPPFGGQAWSRVVPSFFLASRGAAGTTTGFGFLHLQAHGPGPGD